MSLTSELDQGIYLFVVLLFSVFSIASALYIVRQKVVFYSAVALAFLGISVAALIALLSPQAYGIYSVFHLLLYVGATVTFLAITLVLFRGIEVRPQPTTGVVAGFIAAVLVGMATVIIAGSYVPTTFSPPRGLDLTALADELLGQYWFPIVVLIVGLLTTVIEAVALARRR